MTTSTATDTGAAEHDTSTQKNSPSSSNNNNKATGDAMPPSSLRIDPARVATLSGNLSSIQSRIASALSATSSSSAQQPRLVAVSKLKPLSDVFALHTADQHQYHFGENYVQELLEKSRLLWEYEEEGKKVGRGVRWHFIGGLQSNKAVQLAREVKGLWCVESVDSVKKAKGLAKGWADRGWRWEGDENEDGKLRVMIQVNTSGEEGKSGVEPESEELKTLAKCVAEEQKESLRLTGLMTIGAIARSRAAKEGEENEDFVKLKEVRGWLATEMGWEEDQLELSMGMSDDFESAIRLGSNEVRIGSTIFGERPPKNEAKVV